MIKPTKHNLPYLLIALVHKYSDMVKMATKEPETPEFRLLSDPVVVKEIRKLLGKVYKKEGLK